MELIKLSNKFLDLRNLSINNMQKELTKYHLLNKMAAILVSPKVSVFYSKIKKTFPKSSQRFYLAQTLIKHNQNRV